MMNTRVWLVQWRWAVVAAAAILTGVVSGWAQGLNVSSIIQDTGSRIGIDTPNPVDKLTVNGIGGAGMAVRSTDPMDGVYINATAGMTSAQLGVNRQAPNTGSLLYDGANGRFSFFIRNSSDTGNQEALSVLSGQAGAGNVGVGTASPAAMFHVAGNARVDGVTTFNGNVGIATSTPQDRLTINGAGGTGMAVRSGTAGDGVYLQATAGMASAQLGVNRQGANTGSLSYDGVNGRFSLFVRNASDTGNQEALSILSGQAGAGRVQVMGDIQVEGNVAAKYQDVAEWVPAPFPITIGSVVVIDSKARDHVLPSSQAYDTRVAGVVSDRPGILLGEQGSNKVKVASVGRVLVKVDARYGPVEVGDLLVTSLTPGHAMRSTPVEVGGTPLHRPGTLIGKALEPLPDGQGEILVLLSLH